MYQLSKTDIGRARSRVTLGEAQSESLSSRQNGTEPSGSRLRVVRVPGGFAYVADKPAPQSS